MPEINESQIKLALSVAKDISAIKDARRKFSKIRQADLSKRSQILTNRRAVENLFT